MVDLIFGLALACLGLAFLAGGWFLQLTHPAPTTRKEN